MNKLNGQLLLTKTFYPNLVYQFTIEVHGCMDHPPDRPTGGMGTSTYVFWLRFTERGPNGWFSLDQRSQMKTKQAIEQIEELSKQQHITPVDVIKICNSWWPNYNE